MKKIYLSKVFAITFAAVLGITPITACASGKVSTESPVKTVDVRESEEMSEEQEVGVSGSLTPEGNLNLVDDYGSEQREGKQFITVETKSGKYFYIIIDRDDNGMETVHFLNKVDEEDLLALMEEEAVQEYLTEKEAVQTEETLESTAEETQEPGGEVEKEEPAVVGLPPVTGLLLIVGIMGIGGVGGYFYMRKNKKPQASQSADDEDEERSIDLSEMDLDDEDLDMEEEE